MGPGETFAFLGAVVAMSGTVISLSIAWMRHRERMAGLRGKGGGAVHDTVAMLTETLERQHERQQALARRVDALEGAEAARIALPDATDEVPEAAARTAGRRVSA